jgi:hypothetical protein
VTVKKTFKAIGPKGARSYRLFVDGVEVGTIFSTWRYIFGGDCWSVREPGTGREIFFSTRNDAAIYLAHATKEA